jgi:hypothetical protein
LCLCTCGCSCAPVLFVHGVQRRCTGCRPQGSRAQDLRHVPWILWAARTEGEYSCRCPRAPVPKTHIDTNTHTLARAPTRTHARARTYAVANARRDPRRRTHVCVYTRFYRTQPATSIRSVIADELWLGNAAEDLFDAVVEHLEGPRVSLRTVPGVPVDVRRGPVSIPSSQRAGTNGSEVVVRARQSCKLQRPRCNSRPMRSAEAQQAVTYRYVAASLCMKSGSSASARDRIGLCVGLAGTGSAPRATCSRPCMDLAHDTGRRKRGAASVGVKVTGSLRLRSRGHWQVRAWGLGDCGGMCASTPGPVVAKKPPGALDGARERV